MTRAYGLIVERGHCMTTTLRRAAKPHRCDSCERATVPRGAAYLLHKGFPGHDALGGATRPRTLVECRSCAERYGRGHLLPPTASDEQAS